MKPLDKGIDIFEGFRIYFAKWNVHKLYQDTSIKQHIRMPAMPWGIVFNRCFWKTQSFQDVYCGIWGIVTYGQRRYFWEQSPPCTSQIPSQTPFLPRRPLLHMLGAGPGLGAPLPGSRWSMCLPDTQQLSRRRGLQALFPTGRVQAAGRGSFPA